MSDTNAQVATRFYTELMAFGRREAAGELLSHDYVDHQLSPEKPGRDGAIAWLGALDAAFRNRVIAVEEVVSSGAMVSVRWSGSFTHSGAFLGHPATGQTLNVSGVGVFRIEHGRIVERWEHEDAPGLVRQLACLSATRARRLVRRREFAVAGAG